MSLPMSGRPVSAFVGSTFRDLKGYRAAVWDALSDLDTQVRAMEYFGALPGTPVSECLKVVGSCDIYIGIFGMRYGTIPEGYDRSMTHLEYDEAQRLHLPSLIYIIDEEEQPILPMHVETGAGSQALLELKSELRRRHTVSVFTTAENLARRVTRDVLALMRRLNATSRASVATLASRRSPTSAINTEIPFVTFPNDLRQFFRSVEPDLWSALDVTNRRLVTTLGTKLEPIVQLIPRTPVPLVIGFETLAIGSMGESFQRICALLSDVEPGLVRLQLILAAMKTANVLRTGASHNGNHGARHLVFTVNLDAETLASRHLEELLDRYSELWEKNVIFEINERISRRHVRRLMELQADFDIRYCADDFNQWEDDMKAALANKVEMSKVDYEVFRDAMQQRAGDAVGAIDAIAAHRIPGKPLVVEGIESSNHMRFLERHWSPEKYGPLFGQGYAVAPGAPWNSWTCDLKEYGLAGGHVLHDRRKKKLAKRAVRASGWKGVLSVRAVR